MTNFGDSLKTWRAHRRYSQLDLATEAGISARHLSFLETSRARPSRGMVLRLCETLQLPLDARNQLLHHAGFAPEYGERCWSDAEMVPVRRAIDRMLQTHMPYPGLVVDRLWTIVQMNRTAQALYAQFGVGVGDNIVDLITSDGFPGAVENWPELAKAAAARLRMESGAQGGIDRFERAATTLADAGAAAAPSVSPVIPTVLRQGGTRLSMFATIAQIGTPEDVVLDDLKVELYFPTDEATARAFDAMAAATPDDGGPPA